MIDADIDWGQARCTLADVHEVFSRWLGVEYDLDAINVTLAAAAVERLDGDPLWTLLVSGSGNAKTETVQALAGAGATSPARSEAKGRCFPRPSGKRPRRHRRASVQDRQPRPLVIKDVTSILSMYRDTRGPGPRGVAGDLRRQVGTQRRYGRRTHPDMAGPARHVGAVTTAWDRAHDVVARWATGSYPTVDSRAGRKTSGRRAIRNTGRRRQMRGELARRRGRPAGQRATPADAATVTEDEGEGSSRRPTWSRWREPR